MDVTDQITAHLMDAAKMLIAARGNRVGKYALIVQTIVDPDGSFIINWEQYGPDATTDTTGEQK